MPFWVLSTPFAKSLKKPTAGWPLSLLRFYFFVGGVTFPLLRQQVGALMTRWGLLFYAYPQTAPLGIGQVQ